MDIECTFLLHEFWDRGKHCRWKKIIVCHQWRQIILHVVVLAALVVPSVTMIGQMFLGCDRAASVTFFTVALTVNGAVCCGYLGNGLDIAPNFSGIVASLCDNV